MRIALFFCLSLLLFSCGKKRSIVITAKNPVTGQPYAGLSYYVVSSRGNGSRTEASGVLNENGEAAVTLRIKDRSYNVRVVAPENTCYNKNITLSYNYPYDNNHVFSFEFAECANLKLHVHNLNCIDSNDEIKFRRLWLSTNESNDFVIQSGCFQFDGDYFSLPIGNYKYEWYVTKNGVTTFHDSIFTLSENQYFDFTINY
jgi:hypothetical protein